MIPHHTAIPDLAKSRRSVLSIAALCAGALVLMVTAIVIMVAGAQ